MEFLACFYAEIRNPPWIRDAKIGYIFKSGFVKIFSPEEFDNSGDLCCGFRNDFDLPSTPHFYFKFSHLLIDQRPVIRKTEFAEVSKDFKLSPILALRKDQKNIKSNKKAFYTSFPSYPLDKISLLHLLSLQWSNTRYHQSLFLISISLCLPSHRSLHWPNRSMPPPPIFYLYACCLYQQPRHQCFQSEEPVTHKMPPPQPMS